MKFEIELTEEQARDIIKIYKDMLVGIATQIEAQLPSKEKKWKFLTGFVERDDEDIQRGKCYSYSTQGSVARPQKITAFTDEMLEDFAKAAISYTRGSVKQFVEDYLATHEVE